MPQTGEEAAQSQLQLLAKYAPDAMAAFAAQTNPAIGQSIMDTSRQIAPQQAALENQLAAQYGPEMARILSQIFAQQNMDASKSELEIAQGPGRGLVQEAKSLQGILDPEAERTKALVGQGLERYLGSISPDLNGSDIAQINRGLGAGGINNMPDSSLRTLNAARTFGSAGDARKAAFGQALQTASGMINNLRSGQSGFEIATRRQVGQDPSTRLSNPTPVNAQGVSDANFGFANNLLNNLGAAQRTYMAPKKSVMDRVVQQQQLLVQGAGSAAGIMGAI